MSSIINPNNMNVNELIGIAVIFLTVGVIAAFISKKTNFPRVTIIMLSGVFIGQVSRYFDIFPLDTVPSGMSPLIKLTLIIVLYYGGLSIDIDNIRDVLRPGVLLATVGALITAFIIGLSMNLFFESLFVVGGGLILALILGALLAPNDPVAVFSAVESAGLSERPNTIAKMESGLDDTMVTTLTLAVFFPMVLEWSQGGDKPFSKIDHFLFGGFYFIWLTLSAVIIGVLCGLAAFYISRMLDELMIVRLFSLLAAFFCFFFAEAVIDWIVSFPSSGYVAVFTMGMIMARLYVREKTDKKLNTDYSGVCSMWAFAFRMGEMFAFVVLGALVDIDAMISESAGNDIPLIIPAFFIVILLTFITRPVDVLIFTYQTGLELKEKIYIMFVALKGLDPAVISIATVSYYMYDIEIPKDVNFLITLTFSVILLLTVVQSLILWILFREGGILVKKIKEEIIQ